MGGATMSLYYIIEKLDPTIYDAEVLILEKKGEGITFFRKKGIKVHTLENISIYPHAENARLNFISRKPWKPFQRLLEIRPSVKKMSFFFKNHSFDIVHLNTSLLLAAGKAAKLSGAKVVWHIREPLYRGILGLRRRFVKYWIHKYSDKIVAISSIEAERIGRPEKTSIVYNYIDFKKFDSSLSGESIRKEFRVSPGDFLVCNLGGLVHSKGAEVYAKAAMILAGKYPDIKFLLVGYSGGFHNLQGWTKVKYFLKKWLGLKVNQGYPVYKLVKESIPENTFIMSGMRTDIPEILAASDLLAWTATVPHFARPIIEAAAMEKAVVAADFPSAREAMIGETTGLVFQPGSAKDLAKKIEALYHNRNRCCDMGKNGKAIAFQKFNAAQNFEQIEKIYFELMQQLK